MPPKFPADAVDKYRKIKAMAEGGATPAEKNTAASLLAKLEAQYPGIGIEATRPPEQTPIDDLLGKIFGKKQAEDLKAAFYRGQDMFGKMQQDMEVAELLHECASAKYEISRTGRLTVKVEIAKGDNFGRILDLLDEKPELIPHAAQLFGAIAGEAFAAAVEDELKD
jgi:hypothetical protein